MSTLDKEQRTEISELLPWYVNGTLTDEEIDKVAKALETDPGLMAELELILEDRSSILELVSEDPVPSSMPERFKIALNSKIEESEKSLETRSVSNSSHFVQRLFSSLFPTRTVAYAAFAAALVIAFQSAAIVSMLPNTDITSNYQTASGESEPLTNKLSFLVKMKPDADFTKLTSLLTEFNGQIKNGPSADGLFELQFDATAENDELQKLIEGNTELFEFSLPIN